MKGTYLGEFEELVMLSVGVLHPSGYGVAIKNHIEKLTDRKVTLSTVHSSLQRLQNKGFLQSAFGETTKERGGKRKKIFTITMAGSNAIRASRNWREELWATMPDVAIS
jgi:PadR family transcriptional regulator PadR